MMRYLLLIIIILFHNVLFAQLKDRIPTIAEVVTSFYSKYSTDNLEYPHVFFEKRPMGWFVVTNNIIANKVVDDKRMIFYSFSKNEYQDLELPRGNKTVEDVSDFIDPYDLQWFELYPYYGYRGWYKDVIKKIELQPTLSEDDLYLLARAYSNAANSLLSDQLGFSVPEEKFELPFRMNVLSNYQIKQYDSLSLRAIELFKRVKDKNPLYPTIVGDISVKYANEIMVRFHNLLVFATDYGIKQNLPDNLYSDSILLESGKWLNACSKNAIFLSFGDNDFYPLLYLQHHHNFRRDVYVINYNLLAVSRYIFGYTNPLFNSKEVLLSSDTGNYREGINEYLYINESNEEMSVDSLLTLIQNKDEDEILNIPANTFLVNIGKGEFERHKKEAIKVASKYLYKNQWILFDLINNLNTRELNLPHYFSDSMEKLNDYFIWNGFTLQLKNFK